MIVQCENCGAKYNLDDSRIGAEGIKVRCAKCQHVFTVFHPLLLDEGEIFGEKQERAEGPSFKELEKDLTTQPPPEQRKTRPPTPEEGPPPRAFVPPAPEERAFGKEGVAEEKPSLEEELFPFRAPPTQEAPAKKERKISRTFLLSILLIVVIFAAFYYWTQNEVSIPLFESIYERVFHLIEGKKEQKLFFLYLRGSEQKLEGGKVFAIQGKVANRSNETKRYIKLEGLLFDKEGKIVASSIGYCGRTITTKEIKDSNYTSLRSAFGSIDLGNVPPVPSQRDLPFTIIFFSPPAGSTEFKAEIVAAPSLISTEEQQPLSPR